MAKQLIFKDENRIIELQNEITEKLEFLQTHLAPVFALKPTPVNISDLNSLCIDSKAFFTDILIPDGTEINGLNINKTKLFEMLELPENVKNDIFIIEDFLKDWKNTGRYLQFMEVEENQLKVTEKYLAEIEAQNSIYIETEADKAIFNAVTEIKNNMEIIWENKSGDYPFNLNLFKELFIVGDDFGGLPTGGNYTFAINYKYFRK